MLRHIKLKRDHDGTKAGSVIKVVCLLSVFVLPMAVDAQSLSVNGSATLTAATGSTITGTVTCTNLVGGITNVTGVVVFYGPTDGGTDWGSWYASKGATGGITNGDTYTCALTGFNPGKTIYFQSRVTDLSGSAWSAASGSFTTSTSTSPGYLGDYGFRELMRTGTWANVNAATATLTTATIPTLKGLGTITIGGIPYTVGTTTNQDGATILKLTK